MHEEATLDLWACSKDSLNVKKNARTYVFTLLGKDLGIPLELSCACNQK